MIERQECKRRDCARDGVVAVEFAVVAPTLLLILWALVATNDIVDTHHLLETAAREGARFGAMDRREMSFSDQGLTGNQKLEQDIKNFLEAQGIDGDLVTVEVKHHDTNADFNLDDPDNDLELFDVRIKMNRSDMTSADVKSEWNDEMAAAVTFRNSRTNFSD